MAEAEAEGAPDGAMSLHLRLAPSPPERPAGATPGGGGGGAMPRGGADAAAGAAGAAAGATARPRLARAPASPLVYTVTITAAGPLGLDLGAQSVVRAVTPLLPGAHAGIRVGDAIVAVGAEDVRGLDNVAVGAALRRAGRPVALTLARSAPAEDDAGSGAPTPFSPRIASPPVAARAPGS